MFPVDMYEDVTPETEKALVTWLFDTGFGPDENEPTPA